MAVDKKNKRLNGEGTILFLPNGKVRLRQMYGYLPNGGKRYLTVTGTSMTNARNKMNQKIKRLEEQAFLIDESVVKKMTVGELCMAHLKEHIEERGRLKDKSVDRRESTILNQIIGKGKGYTIGRLQVATVKPQDIHNHIEMLLKENKVAVSSVGKAFDVLNAAYKWAQSRQYLYTNPCDPVKDTIKNRLKNLQKRDSSEGVVTVLSEEQINVIMDHVKWLKENGQLYQYIFGLSIILLKDTGMRVGELCALRWSDFDQETGTLNISKTRYVSKHGKSNEEDSSYSAREGSVKNYHSRTIALGNEAINTLLELYRITPKKDMDDYILVNRSMKPHNPTNYDSNLKKMYKKLGLSDDVSGAHTLRRTFATIKHNAGYKVEDIAAYIGDEPATVLKHYISLTQRVVAGDKILNIVRL